MKKLLLLLSLSCCTAFASSYSNLIVFGDSQSDIGNMPESSNAGVNKPFYFNGLPYNLYVPLSNPVYGDQQNPNDQLFVKLFNAEDLPAQPLINQAIRAGRSVNWSQYLFVSMKASGQLQSNEFIPWTMLYPKAPAANNYSVNYAFAGALSNDHCSSQSYAPIADTFCTPAAIFNTENIYRLNASDDDLRTAMVLPGVQKQIDLFSDDLKADRVHVDANTLYIIWSGANDLTNAFLQLLKGETLTNFYTEITQTIPNLIVGVDNSAVSKLYQLGARNIVILSQQNLGLAPEASILTHTSHTFVGRYINAYLLDLLVLRYNIALSEKILALQQRYPDASIKLVNLQLPFNRASLIPGAPFFKNLGLACQNKDATTYQAILNGDLVFCPNYLYWNRAHMTYQGNRMVAEAIMQGLQ